MKCPHCEYKDRDEHYNENRDGLMFRLPVKMEREVKDYTDERTTLYACPKCGKTFIHV